MGDDDAEFSVEDQRRDMMTTIVNICRAHILMARRRPDPAGLDLLESAIKELDDWEMSLLDDDEELDA